MAACTANVIGPVTTTAYKALIRSAGLFDIMISELRRKGAGSMLFDGESLIRKNNMTENMIGFLPSVVSFRRLIQ